MSEIFFMRRIVLSTVSGLMLAVVVAGCGGGDPNAYEGTKRFAVKGKVTFNGEPVDGGVIALQGLDNEKQRKSGGLIVNGEYNIPEAKGPNSGKYRFEIMWPKPTGEKGKDADTGEAIDIKRNVIPEKYNAASELAEEIKPGENTFNFELPLK